MNSTCKELQRCPGPDNASWPPLLSWQGCALNLKHPCAATALDQTAHLASPLHQHYEICVKRSPDLPPCCASCASMSTTRVSRWRSGDHGRSGWADKTGARPQGFPSSPEPAAIWVCKSEAVEARRGQVRILYTAACMSELGSSPCSAAEA